MIHVQYHLYKIKEQFTILQIDFGPPAGNTYVYSKTLVELPKKSTITKLHFAYHICLMFLGMSMYESTNVLCTLLDIQCCNLHS